jgi:hypothetical protein
MWQRHNGDRVGGFQLKFPVIIEKGSLKLPEGNRTKMYENTGKKEVFH